MSTSDVTLTPQCIINEYMSAYRKLYGRDPRVRHIGGQWYYINGETVHRVALLTETARLRDVAKQQHAFSSPTRSMISRLITRLRGI
jgi:hypothetical protein